MIRSPQFTSSLMAAVLAVCGVAASTGAVAADAVTVQLAIMYLILGSVATSVTVIGLGLTRRVFTPDHRLRSIARATH